MGALRVSQGGESLFRQNTKLPDMAVAFKGSKHVSKLAIPEMNGGPSLLLHCMGAKIDPKLILDLFRNDVRDMCVLDCSA
jgi:hypothetical protein